MKVNTYIKKDIYGTAN